MRTAELAERLHAELDGDGFVEINGIAAVQEAQPGELTFLANRKYAGFAETTGASAILVPREWKQPCPAVLLRVENPDSAFACAAEFFRPELPPPVPGTDPSAVVAADAVLEEGVSVGPFCVIESGVRIGRGTVLMAGCYVGYRSVIGADCRLYPHVSLREYVTVGDRVILHNGTVLGSDGFGYSVDGHGVRTKIPQIGKVIIGNEVEIGANVTVDRARFGVTRIGNGVKIDNLVQIAHNVHIGDHAVIVAQVGISGSSEVGSRAILAGQVGIAGHLRVGDGAIVGAQSGVTKDVPPNEFYLGSPAQPMEKAGRIYAAMSRLPMLKTRLTELEARLVRLEKAAGI
jgi:UDP-3-O-[3-hydroxymyristoyl] glucosamine N-acyltransferase